MQLLRIEASNFRQLKEVEIFFPQTGFIGITGDNGAGKSTILNLLDWTFYGKYKDVTQKQIKTRGVAKNASTYTVIDFVFNGDYYRIKRDLSSSPSKNFVQKNGKTEAVGTTQINDYIRTDLLKMDQDSFRACYYAAQDEFDSLVKLNDTPRIKMISRFFKIDTIDIAAEQARKDRRAIEIQIEEFKRHLKDEDMVAEQINQTKIELKEHQKCLKQMDQAIADLEKKRKQISEEKEASDKKNEQYNLLSNTLSNLSIKKETLIDNSLQSAKRELQNLEQKKERLTSIAPAKEEYFTLIQQKDVLNQEKEQYNAIQRINKQLGETQNNIYEYQNAILDANSKIEVFTVLETKASELEVHLYQKEETLSYMRDDVQELLTILKVKKGEYEKKKTEIEHFQQLGTDAPCPTCKQALGQDHFEEELSKLQQELKSIVLEIKTQKEEYEKLSAAGIQEKQYIEQQKLQLKQIHEKLSHKSGFVAKKEGAERELQKQKISLNQLTDERQSLPKKVDFNPDAYNQLVVRIQQVTPLYEEVIQLEKTVEKIPQLHITIEELKHQISKLDEDIKTKEAEIVTLDFNKEAHTFITNELESIRNHIDEQKDKRYTIQSSIDVIANNLKNLENELQEIQTKKNELSGKQEEVLSLVKLDQLFKTYKTDYLAKIAPTLSDMMSDMIDMLTDGRYDRAELDDNYKINIYRNGELQPFEMFSGGEKKLFALCLRLVISQLLVSQTEQANFDMITLDEVFGSFDEKRQDAMIEMFRNLTGMFSQIFVVSHNEHVKNLYDHVLHVEFDKNTFTSKVKWLHNDLDQPTFDHEYIEQLVYERYDLEDEETA